MGAKGSLLKQEIMGKMLETFPNSFLYNDGKEVRINGIENGLEVQIKVTLTAAKTPVENESATSFKVTADSNELNFDDGPQEQIPQEPTEEEKERLAFLLKELGLS